MVEIQFRQHVNIATGNRYCNLNRNRGLMQEVVISFGVLFVVNSL